MSRAFLAARKFMTDTIFVFFSQVLNVRHLWFWVVVMATFLPFTLAGFLFLFGGITVERLMYVITGSMTYAITLQAGLSLGQRIGAMKDRRVFDHYASLPISKLSFTLGLNLSALASSLPSVLVFIAIAHLAFDFFIADPSLFVGTLILGGFSLAGVGAMIGFLSRSGMMAGIVTQIVNPILVFFAPVYIPEAVLPAFIRWVSWFFPTTHVARRLRRSFGAPADGTWQSLVFLVLFIVVSMMVVQRGLDWRGERSLA